MDNDLWTMTVEVHHAAAIDADEVRHAAAILLAPDARHILQALPSARWRFVRADEWDGLIATALWLGDERGLYYTLNPVADSFTGERHFRSSDFAGRRWLLIDADAEKPDKDLNATDAEKEAALAVADAAWSYLSERGWPMPLVIDSGNGWHLLYRVDLPNDRLSQQWLAQVLRHLASRFDTESAKIDRKTHDAKRISKLPGTWVRKGPCTDDRPHRMSRLVYVPETLQIVSVTQLRELAGSEAGPTSGHSGPPDAWMMRVGGDGRDRAYARAALEREVGRITVCASFRNNTLYEAALKLGGYVATGLLDRSEVERDLDHAARAAGLPDPADPHEIDRAIKNGLEAGLQTPKQAPSANGHAANGTFQTAMVVCQAETPSKLVIGLDEVEPEDVQWLWQDRIAIGFISLFAGRTGEGKSFVTCDFAARMSRGDPAPESATPLPIGSTLFISEDPVKTMLAPRLLGLDAVQSRIKFMTWEAMASYSLANIAMLQQAWDEAGRPTLIVIDPPANFLAGKDQHKDAEVRQVVMNIVTWLDKFRVACVFITHINKNIGKGVEALDRIMGSVAWTSTSRIALAFLKDPDNPDRHLFAGLKNNLGQKAGTLSYEIARVDDVTRVLWHGPVDIDADAAINGQPRKPRAIVATEWLEAMFRRQPRWDARELNRLAREEGLSRDALIEGRRKVPIRWTRIANPHGDYDVVWFITDPNWPPPDPGIAVDGVVATPATPATPDAQVPF